MEFVTAGKKLNSGIELLLFCCPREVFDYTRINDRFRIIFIESGAGVLCVNNNRILFNAPAIFCLNETEEVVLAENSSVLAFSVYFHPSTINSVLNFDNLRGDRSGMTATERNDCTCLSPFYSRSDKYHGQLSTGITVFKSIHHLFLSLENELKGQKDGYWPCRSRSYLIEILFMLQRVFLNPDIDKDKEILLNSISEFVGQIIIYLHTNYEKKITIEELSKLLSINRTSLNERFREETGMTAIAYLIDLRIRLACLILRDTLIPVSEIAERVGFNDTAHFTRTFVKLTGHSPSGYRQANSWQLK